eukprot:TRINITY_DN12707_c0_g1_i2.p1 TRINITY_DN12707_c0_g1~~TRINITY_DN12707_c0_g1_i2.p1  ORF type:complete len:231 (+),score=34.95 TRINITY_DN12707_c0_g1_i2:124-816(+)
MEAKNIPFTKHAYTAVIRCLMSHNESDAAIMIFRSLDLRDIRPDHQLVTSVIPACATLQEALQLVRQYLVDRTLEITPAIISALYKLCRVPSDIEEVDTFHAHHSGSTDGYINFTRFTAHVAANLIPQAHTLYTTLRIPSFQAVPHLITAIISSAVPPHQALAEAHRLAEHVTDPRGKPYEALFHLYSTLPNTAELVQNLYAAMPPECHTRKVRAAYHTALINNGCYWLV